MRQDYYPFKQATTSQIHSRILSYGIGLIASVVIYFIVSLNGSFLVTSVAIPTSLVSSILSLVISGMAVVKYITRRKPMYLFITYGLLIPAFLYAYAAGLLTSTPDLMWPYYAAITVQAVAFFMSIISWKSKFKNYFYILTILASVVIPLVSPTLVNYSFPIINIIYLAPFSLTVISLLGYLKKQYWTAKNFEHWFVLSLIVSSVWTGLLLITHQPQPALIGVFSILSLSLILVGLLTSMFAAFREVEIGSKKLFRQNEELMAIEKKLASERDRARLIISSMAEGLLVIGQDYNIELINPVAEKLLEVSSPEALGEQWSSLVTAYESDIQIPFKQRTSILVLKTGKTIVTKLEADHYYQTKSGKKFSIASITAPIIAPNNQIIGAVKVFRDATQERFTKQEIERQVVERTKQLMEARDQISQGWVQVQMEKARLKASIDSLSLGYIMTDKDLNVITYNPAIDKILGLSHHKTWTIKDLGAMLKGQIDLGRECRSCLEKNSVFETDKLSHNNKFLRIFISPIHSLEKKNQIIGLVILLEDITEAQLLDRTKDEFFAVASHELRTPLSAIKGNIEIIQDHFKDALKNKNVESMMDDIHQSTIRLTKIVNDFLDVSRLEQNQIDTDIKPFNIVPVIKACIREIIPDFKAKKLTIATNPAQLKPAIVSADLDHTKQIIANLLKNASRYTKSGGATISLNKSKDFVEIDIADTGVGIPEKNQKFLFRKFFQATDNLLTRQTTQGTGLGLYISKKLANQMEADVYLKKTKTGEGSTFTLKLPIKTKKSSKPPKPDLVKVRENQ